MIFQKRLNYEMKLLGKSQVSNCKCYLKSGQKWNVRLTDKVPDLLLNACDLSQLMVVFYMEENDYYFESKVVIYINLQKYPVKRPLVKIDFGFLHPGIDQKGQICREIFSQYGTNNKLIDYVQKIINFIKRPHDCEVLNIEAATLLSKGSEYFKQYSKK